MQNERVKDCGHDEVGDATTSVAPSTSQCVGGTDDVLVEEAGTPDLARHKSGTQHANEEACNIQARCVFDQRSESYGQAADEDKCRKDSAGAKLVAERAGGEAEEEG